jgi:NitT/TauT family transport system substrate-binding protein
MKSRLGLCLVVLVAVLALPAGGAHGHGRPEPIPVRIGVPTADNLQFLAFWVAAGAGYFEDEGLDVELVSPPMPGQLPQLLLQGQVDAAVMQAPLYLGMIGQEHPVALFAGLLTNDPINLIVDEDVAESLDLSATAPLPERLDAIRGLRIGVADEASNRLRVLFEAVGMDPDQDVEIVVLHGEDQIPALTGGTVAALYTHTPFLEEALVDHGAFMLINQSAGDVPELARLQIHTMVATRTSIHDNPRALLRVTRAVYRAQRLVHSDPAEAVAAVLDSGVPDLMAPRIEALVDVYGPAIPRSPVVSPEGVVRTADLWEGRPVAPDFTQIDVRHYISNRFARKAVRTVR